MSVTRGLAGGIRSKIKAAGPAVQKLAAETLEETFTGYAGSKTAPGGLDTTSTFEFHLEAIAGSLADVPGGLDVLYEIARQRKPNEILPYKDFFLNADSSQFGPKLKKAIQPIIMEELIPEFVGRNRAKLHQFSAGEIQSSYAGGSRDAIDGLVALYDRADHKDYGWRMFMDLRNAKWTYHSFDPIPSEQVPFDQLITRYRKVSLPKDMDKWFETAFEGNDANNHGAFKWGKSPFGHYMGKMPAGPVHKCRAGCTGPGCYGATKINSFWEKEVLLLRQHFKVPPIKPGHRYRLRVNDGNHVGSGGGHIIYINGEPLIEAKTCNSRGSGGLPKGAYITRDFLDDFKGGNVCIAVMTFLRYNDKYKVKPKSPVSQGKFSLHIEEQKLPPMGDDLVLRSATLVPMLSSDWQARQDPNDREQSASAVKFRWDGQFIENPEILGSWKVVTEVAEIADFDPVKKVGKARNPLFSTMTFKEDGMTEDPTWLWSADTLMDLNKYQALMITPRTLTGDLYLFIESGGFGTRNKPGWKPKWYVMKSQAK